MKRQILTAFSLSCLVTGCYTKSATTEQRADTVIKGIFGFSSRTPRQSITLRDGRIIDVKNFTIDSKTTEFIENNFEDYNSVIQNQMTKDIKGELGLKNAEVFSLIRYTVDLYLFYKLYFSPDANFNELSNRKIEATLLGTVSALNKLPHHHGIVHFGACLPINIFLPALNPGKIFWSNNFTSTSTNKSIALRFASNCGPDVASFLFTIEKSHSGSNISEFSHHKEEEEVLFLPAQPFRVKSITPRAVGTGNNPRAPTSPEFDVFLEEIN